MKNGLRKLKRFLGTWLGIGIAVIIAVSHADKIKPLLAKIPYLNKLVQMTGGDLEG